MNHDVSVAERNAIAAAVAQYRRWLIRRYQKIDVVELSESSETADPIALQQIYVPVRLDADDMDDERAHLDQDDQPLPVKDETLPGREAFEVLAEEPLVLLSGRPGSGKTTLVHAVVAALAHPEAGRLRRSIDALPVPFILRRLPDLDSIRSLEDLFRAWWPEVEKQAAKDRLPLDRARLGGMLCPGGATRREQLSRQAVLLLFDGIDEVGGPKTRQRLLDIAFEARRQGYRVLVTGRPTGYAGLGQLKTLRQDDEAIDSAGAPAVDVLSLATSPEVLPANTGLSELPLHHMQPFAWPQIQQFIEKWYALRDEWQKDADDGIRLFLQHLAEPGRRTLLVLARRPIFLALMALVNCTERQMPEGRARLYALIVDLYLNRQERVRQRKAFAEDGAPMPRWPAHETLRVLSGLALESQNLGTEQESDEDSRRFLWQKAELEAAVQSVVRDGRYAVLTPDDAPTLVKYFLNPAGLLVQPTEDEIQFAHLSFQEYLCAVELHERAKVAEDGPLIFSQTEVFPMLEKPGWQEVGMLYLCVYSEATGKQGHLNLLKRLDISRSPQAGLYVAALSGLELEFMARERAARLPVALMCALLHPGESFGVAIGRMPDLEDGEGLGWILKLLEAQGDTALWEVLAEAAAAKKLTVALDSARSSWYEPKEADDGAEEARAQAVLQLVADAEWGQQDNEVDPIRPGSDLDQALGRWLARSRPEDVLWRQEDKLPSPTRTCFELDRLLPSQGAVWEAAVQRLPLEAAWLQGDIFDDEFVVAFSQSVTLQCLYPRQSHKWVQMVNRTAQILAIGDALGVGQASNELSRSLSLYLSRSLPLSLSLSHSLPRSHSRSRSRFLSHSLYLSRSRSRSLSLYLSLSRSLSRSRSRSRSLSLYLSLSHSRSRSLYFYLSLSLEEATRQRFERWLDQAEKAGDDLDLQPMTALMQLGLRQGAFDGWERQATDPELARHRGVDRRSPLPAELGFFDGEGRLKTVQRRDSVVALRDFLEDEDRLLDWLLEGWPVEAADRQRYRDEVARLNAREWGPLAYVQAVLEDWPTEQEEMDVSFEAGERRLLAALEAAGV